MNKIIKNTRIQASVKFCVNHPKHGSIYMYKFSGLYTLYPWNLLNKVKMFTKSKSQMFRRTLNWFRYLLAHLCPESTKEDYYIIQGVPEYMTPF